MERKKEDKKNEFIKKGTSLHSEAPSKKLN